MYEFNTNAVKNDEQSFIHELEQPIHTRIGPRFEIEIALKFMQIRLTKLKSSLTNIVPYTKGGKIHALNEIRSSNLVSTPEMTISAHLYLNNFIIFCAEEFPFYKKGHALLKCKMKTKTAKNVEKKVDFSELKWSVNNAKIFIDKKISNGICNYGGKNALHTSIHSILLLSKWHLFGNVLRIELRLLQTLS